MAALELHQRSIQELIKTVKALHTKVQQSEGKTEQLQTTLGLTLKEAKDRKPEGITWPDFVKEHFDFGRSRADELIQIADGRTTVEKTRADKAASTANSKARLKDQAAATGGGSPQPTADAPKEDQTHQIADAGSPADAVEASKLALMRAKADRAEATSAPAKAKSVAAEAVAPSDDQRKAALRLAVVNDNNVVTFTPKADGDPIKDPDPLSTIEGDNPDTVDITNPSFGAHAIYTALSTIDLAQTTAEDFWAIFGMPHLMPGTVEWLGTAIRKLAEIKAGQPQGAA
jgi:hypothetical protein